MVALFVRCSVRASTLSPLLLLVLLGGCATAALVENVRGRPEGAPERSFAVELKEAFLRDDGQLVLVGYRKALGYRQTWEVRLTPPFESPVAIPWAAWHLADEPKHPVVLRPDSGDCSFAGRMREAHRSIPVYAADEAAPARTEAVIVQRSPIRLRGRDARTAETQAVVLWSSGGESAELGRVELAFLEDVRASRLSPGYLWLLPLSLTFDTAFTAVAIAIAPPIIAADLLSSDAPTAEELQAARQKGCRCLTREGAGEIPDYWTCYEPRLF